MLIRREPALWFALFAIIIKVVCAFWVHVSITQQSLINAAVAALFGIVVAISVHDGVGAAILGFAQATIALAVGLGLHWAPDQQALIMSLIAALVAMFVRTQVAATVGPLATAINAGPATAPAPVQRV